MYGSFTCSQHKTTWGFHGSTRTAWVRVRARAKVRVRNAWVRAKVRVRVRVRVRARVRNAWVRAKVRVRVRVRVTVAHQLHEGPGDGDGGVDEDVELRGVRQHHAVGVRRVPQRELQRHAEARHRQHLGR